MTTSGWVWHEWADWQSISRWENEGGSYQSCAGDDTLERYEIIRTGFKRSVSWDQSGGYLANMARDWAYSSAYRAGLRGDQNWPRLSWWINADNSEWIQKHMHDAFWAGINDDQTRAELAKLGYVP